ncbi:restriction endonuclease [Streptomyces sp. NPDC053048]|uniref:restriction endonuclease n=1 Tax=Streptomyces sp. NPDC053048 TaxID=3365694 RepID=UPI0037D4BDBA
MIVNDATEVRPHRYADKDFRKVIGSDLGKATADEFLAAWMWVQEGVWTRLLWEWLREHRQRVQRELTEAASRAQARHKDTLEPISDACRAAASRLSKLLETELTEAEQAERECIEAWKAMRDDYGIEPIDLYEDAKASPVPSRFESVMPLWHQTVKAGQRLDAALAADMAELHRIALLEARLMAFIQSDASITLPRIDAMDYREFERLAARLVERDGYKVVRPKGGAGDLGADVIAEGPGGTVVVQCKHTTSGTAVGSPVLQRLNGTARPVHGADIVIAMTNGTFSLPAVRFAESQRIHLIDNKRLEQWATWGQPLEELLGNRSA